MFLELGVLTIEVTPLHKIKRHIEHRLEMSIGHDAPTNHKWVIQTDKQTLVFITPVPNNLVAAKKPGPFKLPRTIPQFYCQSVDDSSLRWRVLLRYVT